MIIVLQLGHFKKKFKVRETVKNYKINENLKGFELFVFLSLLLGMEG